MEITEKDPLPKRRRPNQLPSLTRATPAQYNAYTKGDAIDSFGSGYLENSASITDLKEDIAISSSLNVSNSQLHKHTLATAALADGGDISAETGVEMEEIPLQLRNIPSQPLATATTSDTLPPPYSPS
jgi:hypothetical protein